MKVFVCNNFTGFYPVGSAAVIVAEDHACAVLRLNEKLKLAGLVGDASPADVREVFTGFPNVEILVDGNY